MLFALLLVLTLQEGPVATAPAELPDPSVPAPAEPTLAPGVLTVSPVAPPPDAAASAGVSDAAGARAASSQPAFAQPGAAPVMPPPASAAVQPPAQPFVYPRSPDPSPYAYRRPSTSSGAAHSEDAAFDSSLRGRAVDADGGRGVLDGGWVVTSSAGERLFAFQLLDEGRGALDGAWTALDGPLRSGFFALASRRGGDLVLRWIERPGGPPNVLSLQPTSDTDVWRGSLERAGDLIDVQMRSR